MSDLICANCQNFAFAACPPRCEPNYYPYAEADTPACARFARVHETSQLQRLKDMGYTENDLEKSNPFNAWMRSSDATA